MSRPRIVIVGAGFAGYGTARTLARLAKESAEIVLVNPNDYFLYVPLLPEVATGVLEPRQISVPLAGTLPGVRLVLGEVDAVDLERRRVGWTDPEGNQGGMGYDRLVLAAGSVNKLLPIPGVAEHAHGFRGLPEALYLRDHITRQIELADTAEDPAERAARCTFVVVGAGYTGTEVAAHGRLFTDVLARRHPRLGKVGHRPQWLLLDVAPRVLPELDRHMADTASRVLRKRGVEVLLGTSVQEATHDGVRLTDGRFVPTRSLIWCVGVRPDPLVAELGLKTNKGRLVVDEYLNVPGHPEVFACGDAAAVPDPTRAAGEGGVVTPGVIGWTAAVMALAVAAVDVRRMRTARGTREPFAKARLHPIEPRQTPDQPRSHRPEHRRDDLPHRPARIPVLGALVCLAPGGGTASGPLGWRLSPPAWWDTSLATDPSGDSSRRSRGANREPHAP